MEYTLRGSTLPVLDMKLSQGETVFTESGGMAWMSANIDMDSNLRGGVGGAFGRALSGESLFMVNYTSNNGTGIISFCSEMPGTILPFDMSSQEHRIICQRDAFMVAEESVELDMEFKKKLGAGFFGGEGFFLQKISGEGMAFLELDGEITEYVLEKNQKLRVDPGYIGAFESSVDYDIEPVSGIKNMLFGGEGIFLATLSGPGKIWLQSMPIANLVNKIASNMKDND